MYFLIIIATLIVWFAIANWFALLTNNVLSNKGYNENYWLGFFFGALAWLYCIALPDLKVQKAIMELSEKIKKNKQN